MATQGWSSNWTSPKRHCRGAQSQISPTGQCLAVLQRVRSIGLGIEVNGHHVRAEQFDPVNVRIHSEGETRGDTYQSEPAAEQVETATEHGAIILDVESGARFRLVPSCLMGIEK